MRVLTVPNWSFGRDRDLLRLFRDTLDATDHTVHFCESDPDHNRTVTAFAGRPDAVEGTLRTLCTHAFERLDLTRHVGVHPRIGALDVCPLVALDGDPQRALELAERMGRWIGDKFGVPVYLYEKSERGVHANDLPSLRKGGFGALHERELRPDFGPTRAHHRLGVSVVGVRDFLIAFNVNVRTEQLAIVEQMAADIRALRQEGDPRFLGVRALGLPLASRELTQVSLTVTLPDLTPLDPMIDWIEEEAVAHEAVVDGCELIGVIRREDLAGATRLRHDVEQVVETTV